MDGPLYAFYPALNAAHICVASAAPRNENLGAARNYCDSDPREGNGVGKTCTKWQERTSFEYLKKGTLTMYIVGPIGKGCE